MQSTAKSKERKNVHPQTIGIIDPNVRSYANDPTIIKRAKEAKEWLKKVGLPEQLKGKYKI